VQRQEHEGAVRPEAAIGHQQMEMGCQLANEPWVWIEATMPTASFRSPWWPERRP